MNEKDKYLQEILQEIPEEDREKAHQDMENFYYEFNLRIQEIEKQLDEVKPTKKLRSNKS